MNAETNFDKAIRPDAKRDLLKSSFRTTDLFEFLAGSEQPVTIGEISQQLNIPQSSSSSLVKSLMESGFLQKDDASRGYMLSPRLPLLGLKYLERFPNIGILRDQVARLAETVDETTVLAMRNGLYSQYIYIKRKSPQIVDKHVSLGSLRPLACSATGWAMMTVLSEEEIGKVIRATHLSISDKHWEHNLKIAQSHIQAAKDKGYAFSRASQYSNTAGIAKFVPQSGPESYAICVAGPERRLIEKQSVIAEALQSLT